MKNFVRKEDINELTIDLVESLKEFSLSMPNDEVYELKRMLSNSAETLPKTIENATHLSGKLGVIRGMIQINSNLDECIDYLTMAEKLKFGKTENIMKKVAEFSSIINNTFTLAI